MITYSPDLTPDYDIGTVATYVCNAGFVLDLTTEGSETRTCVALQVWNDQEPRCIRKCMDKYIIEINLIPFLLLHVGVEISFSMAIFEFTENDGQGFVEFVTNRPSPQSF